ncbi:1,3-beta-glucanosyltransferase gas1 [Blyttiomyces sp. JEL0837]|nr:1,3-beta-glucanosyltransferase gas1 [Blyttiomyces sp. JEL0837]
MSSYQVSSPYNTVLMSWIWLSLLVLEPKLLLRVEGYITVRGNKFVDTSDGGGNFVIKGIAYQPREDGIMIDPIEDGRKSSWSRDLDLMAELGLNVVRVYEVEPDSPHEKFMNALQSKNMSLLLDLGHGKWSLNRANPEYTIELLNRMKATIDAFSKFTNVVGFIAGNEVINAVNNTAAAPFEKALIRDLKSYMKTKERYIPIGYVTSDDATVRQNVVDYFACGDDESTHPDFLGLNLYEWCGHSSYQESGYKDRTEELKPLGIPLIISEYGCNKDRPRTFEEVSAIYGPEMSSVWSGAVLYEFSEEENDFGIVEIDNGVAIKTQEFENFKSAMKNVNATHFKPHEEVLQSSTRPSCPAISDNWKAVASLPPTPSLCVCNLMVSSLRCVTTLTKGSSDQSEVSRLIGVACGLLSESLSSENNATSCGPISAGDGSIGDFGAYAACDNIDKLSWAYNKFYQVVSATIELLRTERRTPAIFMVPPKSLYLVATRLQARFAKMEQERIQALPVQDLRHTEARILDIVAQQRLLMHLSLRRW